jgi:hypothetical protein
LTHLGQAEKVDSIKTKPTVALGLLIQKQVSLLKADQAEANRKIERLHFVSWRRN